ncbi:MAG: ribosomal protein S18-alanine N-acetyltransferase [bacterium]|nr:ribosomal protein S18-alanine N-acetyltransferase [bacterium]MCM1373980.1 ribosomal protein S18-alanine N-acetyltransferase [Muribaculum sp.]
MIIRELRAEDVEPLSVIEARSFSMPWTAADFARLIEDRNSLYLVAEVDGRVVGCCGVTNVSGDGEIDNVVVDEAYRNRGIATALLRETLRTGYAMGVEAFTLEVRVSNAPALHIYEKAGFVSEGIRPRFYERPTEDAMILWKRDKTVK